MTMMLALGALIAVLTGVLAEWSSLILQPLGSVIMILMGLLLLLEVNPFARLSLLSNPTTATGPHIRAFLYGLLFAPMIMPEIRFWYLVTIACAQVQGFCVSP